MPTVHTRPSLEPINSWGSEKPLRRSSPYFLPEKKSQTVREPGANAPHPPSGSGSPPCRKALHGKAFCSFCSPCHPDRTYKSSQQEASSRRNHLVIYTTQVAAPSVLSLLEGVHS